METVRNSRAATFSFLYVLMFVFVNVNNTDPDAAHSPGSDNNHVTVDGSLSAGIPHSSLFVCLLHVEKHSLQQSALRHRRIQFLHATPLLSTLLHCAAPAALGLFIARCICSMQHTLLYFLFTVVVKSRIAMDVYVGCK